MHARMPKLQSFLLSLLILLLCDANAHAQTAAEKSLDAKVAAMIDPEMKKVIAWRRDFHQHPELSNREFRTSGEIAKFLSSLGLQVQTGVAKTGVVALL